MEKKVKKKVRKSVKNPWLEHLKEYKMKHPNKPYGECMAEAKKTYKR
jgi:hypothetical protein